MARRQLLELGMGPDAVQDRLELGRLHPVHGGVYAVGHTVISQRGRWMAAVLASGVGAVLSHRSAAALWGIRPLRGGAIHVTVPYRSRSSARIRRHVIRLPPDEVTTLDGIPVTTVPRTTLDIAATSPIHEVEAAIRQAEYLRLYDRLSPRDLVDRYPGQRGVARLRTCLALLAETPAGRTRSPLEDLFLPFLDRHNLPRPSLNAWVEANSHRYEVDCLWPTHRLIAELDGFQSHATRHAFHSDRARDRRLTAAKYEVIRISHAQLTSEPEALAADLRTLLRP